MNTEQLLHAVTDYDADVGESDRFDLWCIITDTGELRREAINIERSQVASYLDDYQNTDRGTFRLFFATHHYPITDGSIVIDALAKLSTWLPTKIDQPKQRKRSTRATKPK